MSDTTWLQRAASILRAFQESDHPAVSLARDLLWVVTVVACIALALYLFAGTWPAVVTIESESMVPNMNVGDLVLVVDEDRFGNLVTWAEGQWIGHQSFGDYGDVIIYRPNGVDSVHPIIHRAMTYVDTAAVEQSALRQYYEDPHGGYITKGDNNPYIDQGNLWIPGVGIVEPVKKEWIVGKALIAVPFIGYLPLHLTEFAIVVIVIIIVHDFLLARRKGKEK
ncbi:MAG TPA: S26 family signal peptidase [Candidatus Methanoculleus thermohydrogenotrophicum]|jgi:signal peptidase|nr:S26 family signal peptidase [Candidatus Methanoculleus thermohydrogenotrophicum]NLM82008.1 S26 family signal peptidase [Candidatus Methanoculleus thermohydrogenotrophicum]HOB17301.1 S26 family signal peptidase [Candidatus Methanoculleus thermohydrogenotrophicum]HPZ37414.1 S26 family signal peptidase [Candidatus Methanoculleus thermohydrogenotrophicum]HQC90909.1 S26 family signal peptidase [Candidatus Methanoculleus thermohydrogenotrophicum]